MKTIIALLFCASLLHSHAADEPLIPASLNAILPKIHARMTIPEVEAALTPAYPKVKGEGGIWSGQTGYINYKLDERFTLSISSITRDGKEVVHDELLLYLHDYPAKRRLDLKVNDWEKEAEKQPKQPAAQSGNKAPETAGPSAEDLALVKGLIVTGTLTKVIGYFNTYGHPSVGDSFEMDLSNLPQNLSNLPQKMIKFTSPNTSYIPFSAPMIIERVSRVEPVTQTGRASINLSANDASGKFLIQVQADTLEKGSKVRIFFYRASSSFIGGMAEAEGVFNVKDTVSSNLPPKAGEEGEQPAQPAETNKPDAQVWPPPLNEKRLIGTWVRKNQPTQGVENHTLLVLREDHSWNEAEISGPLTEPVRFKKFANDSTWEVPDASAPTSQATLLFKYKAGGFNSMSITRVGVNELDMSRWGGAIMDIRHYTRCDAQTAAKLNERMNQKETGPTAK